MQLGDLPPESRAILEKLYKDRQFKLNENVKPDWIEQNPPSPDNLKNPDWWKQARRYVVGLLPEEIGATYCREWARKMHLLISKYSNQNPQLSITSRLMYSIQHDHWWVEVEIEDRYAGLYDGTAGQKAGRQYSSGLYGEKSYILGSLPRKVAEIYTGKPVERSSKVK